MGAVNCRAADRGTPVILERLSEATGALGGITAEGMINVLGRPPFDTLTLVLREAAQNSWDARQRKRDPSAGAPEFEVRIRTLVPSEDVALRRLFSAQGADDEPSSTNELARELASPRPIRVLEVCDFETTGLCGSVDPREPSDTPCNFRNFFFDLGVAHPASGDGGTYGYGRSALYLASRARTIVVDTLAMEPGILERRLMACRIGHAYERRSFVGGGSRFTGRHFWGRRIEDGIGPLTGSKAADVAASIGLPNRAECGGTSIMIPWPDPPDARINGRWIVEVLLCHLWPKLVSPDAPSAMRFRVLDEHIVVPIPSLAFHPVYSLFAAALLSARTRSGAAGAREIRFRDLVTGHLGLEVASRAEVASTIPASEGADVSGFRSPLDGSTRHVALMRPSELVVRYLEVPEARLDGRPWAGVFVCSDEDPVLQAFALAEPPAHDDWIPDRIEDPSDRRLVSATVRRLIPAAVRDAFGKISASGETLGPQSSLALAADVFSRQFLTGPGTAASKPSPRPVRRAAASGGQYAKITGPWLEILSIVNGERLARYRIRVTGLRGHEMLLRAHAEIAIDAPGTDLDLPLDLAPPQVVCWRHPTGALHLAGAELRMLTDGEVVFDVAFRGEYAIAVKVEAGP